jgi:hypothetical protein
VLEVNELKERREFQPAWAGWREPSKRAILEA